MADYFAHANIEVPLWGENLGRDPRTGQDVWDPVLDDDGRQATVVYRRGDAIEPGHFREEDLAALYEGGAIAEGPPEPDPIPGLDVPLPPGATAVVSTDEPAATAEESNP